MEKALKSQELLRWTLAEASGDAALFIPGDTLPPGIETGCRVVAYIQGDGIVLDMDGTEIHLQAAHPDTARRLNAMSSFVVAERGTRRCWVTEVNRG